MNKSCYNCAYAIITTISECTKCNKTGDYIHRGGISPPEQTCQWWEQADDFTIEQNSIDWTKARTIIIEKE